jgi:TolA-binding protein
MQLSDEDLKDLWQAATKRGTNRSECLSSETLMRAGANELDAPEAERIAAHLAACADCTEEYQIAMSVRDWATETAAQHTAPVVRVTPQPSWWSRLLALFNPLTATLTMALLLLSLALSAVWVSFRRQNQTLIAQVEQQRRELNDAATLKAQIEVLQRQQAELNARLAQQQTAGQEALQAEIERLKKELEQGAQPQLDLPQFDIDPTPATRSAGSNAKVTTINVPAAATSFTLNLPGAGSKPFPNYLIELQDAKTAKVVWSAERKQDNETTFTVTLSNRNLPAGSYRVRVFGVTGKQKKPLQDYEMQVSYATPPDKPKSP